MARENKVPAGFPGIRNEKRGRRREMEERKNERREAAPGRDERGCASSPTHLFALDVEGGA